MCTDLEILCGCYFLSFSLTYNNARIMEDSPYKGEGMEVKLMGVCVCGGVCVCVCVFMSALVWQKQ